MAHVPSTPPLERLQVTDGLLLTAERWRVAHSYHRQRQNLQFQAACQGGIVAGLGVCPTIAPAQVAAQYRDERWLQVQPGLAIDREGNPIVVPRPIPYHIAAEPGAEPLQVYLVVSFVDPDGLERQDSTCVVQETFRLEEKVSPPDATEVELCRIWLSPGEVRVRSPRNGFVPAANELDLRYRPWIQPRAKGELRLGYLTLSASPNASVEATLNGLVAPLPTLYPPLSSHSQVQHVPLREASLPLAETMALCDLLHVAYRDAQQLHSTEVEAIETYLAAGGVVMIEVPAIGTELDELVKIWAEVLKALERMSATAEAGTVYDELCVEQLELERCMALELETRIPPLAAVMAREAQAFANSHGGQIQSHHPLRMQPFRFGLFPLLRGNPLALFSWGGVVVTVGGLSAAWDAAKTQFLSRDTVRSAQELGVNLLHFAWQRRQWADCLTPSAPVDAPSPPNRMARLDAIYDQLDRD
ncbi:hypothetical protein ACQ4M4_18145 [Leptolyngbya sp. AN02str]|uniref:hypothetical protein n=1 Tax=Leptolyngbya sp. AN02str TaxID=3423363 RepID=UPI003D323389